VASRLRVITGTGTGRGAGIAAIGATLIAALSVGGAQAQSDCPGADSSSGDTAALESAMQCLIAKERAEAGVPALEPNGPLASAAREHAREMVAAHFFATESPRGESTNERSDRWGYGGGALGIEVGGLIASGSGTAATPRANFAAWRSNARLRALIVDPAFRDFGVGATPGSPTPVAGDAATYVAYIGSLNGVIRPTLGESIGAQVLEGAVSVAPPGAAYERLATIESVGVNSTLDARNGKVRLAAASNASGGIVRADVDGGKFKVTQSRGSNPVTELTLRAVARCSAKRRLTADSKGAGFRTKGKYATATGGVARWVTEDSCAGTRVTARSGVVKVRNRRTGSTRQLKAGQSTLVRR